jgi:ribosomal protein L11 methyltransferase
MTTWTKLTFASSTSNPSQEAQESLSCELVAHGALGTTVEADGSVTCFCETARTTMDLMRSVAEQWGFAAASEEVLEQQNWNRQCAELWEPFTRGIITVVPVESSHDTTPLPDRHIKIIPGLGFGTGHHPTTNMILGILSELSEQNFQPRSVFDLGTGSGILAIAAARLFAAPIIANDIDPHAIENAEENSGLNHTTHLISNTTAATSDITG